MSEQGQGLIATEWGLCSLTWSQLGIVRLRLPDSRAPVGTHEADSRLPAIARRCAELLHAYFSGDRIDFRSVPLDVGGLSEAEAGIYAALREVRYGETVSYGSLAARAGLPGGARAVGAAMARNPWPILVPCHRVLAKGGALGGFSAPGGVATKRRLLALEGVPLDQGEPLLPGLLVDG